MWWNYRQCQGLKVSGARTDLGAARPGDVVHVAAGTPHWFRWNRGGGAMLPMTSRFGATRLLADIDLEIAPYKPDVESSCRLRCATV